MSDPSTPAAVLAGLAASIPAAGDDEWLQVETNARSIADTLRTKTSADHHTKLGEGSLPATIKSLLDAASTNEHEIPKSSAASAATYELLRVGANICMDHDVNRQILLDAGVPQRVAALLQSYSTTPDASLQISDLKVVRTAIGLLLNTSLGFEPVRTALIASGAPTVVLTLASTLAKPAGWVTALADGKTPDDVEEFWKWRSGIANWSSRLIAEFTEHDDKTAFTPDCLPALVGVISAFTPPYPQPAADLLEKLPSLTTFIETDVETLDQASSLLEAFTLDIPAFGLAIAANGGAHLQVLVEFAEHGAYPSYWSVVPEKDRTAHEKSFNLCKAAVIKSIVATAGEDGNIDVLWQDVADAKEPHGWFVSKLVQWIRAHADGASGWDREDLTICATLSLGNIARREAICDSLAQPPLSIGSTLLPFLEPAVDLKVKHGVLGLLKNLAHAQRTRATLGDAGIIEALAASRVWTRDGDFAEIVQLNAIGIVKQLCTGNLDNTLRLTVPDLPPNVDPDAPAPATAMELVLALAIRSDSVSVKSEGTRLLGTAVRALYTAEPQGDVAVVGRRRRKAIDAITTFDGACQLSAMIVRSRKYAVLLNEAVVALTLLAHHSSGASYVLHSLSATSANDPNPSPSTTSGTGLTSPVSPSSASSATAISITNALDMLAFIAGNDDTASTAPGGFPPELRANVCSLLGTLGKKNLVREQEDVQVGRVKPIAVQVLQGVLDESVPESGDEKARMLRTAAQKALETWQPTASQ